MQWTQSKEVLLMREILGKDVQTYKPGSSERGQGWQKVADTLSTLEGFFLTDGAVRDKISMLMKKNKVLINKEKGQTGIGGDEPTEYKVLIEEIINISEDTLQKTNEASEKAAEKENQDRASALEIRQIAMETMGQTAERKKNEKPPKERRSKRSSSDTLDFLRQKLEMDKENRKVKMEEKRHQNAIFSHLINTQQQMMAQQMAILKELVNDQKN